MKRRDFLRSSGVLMALPALEVLGNETTPQRMVAINIPLGFHAANFFPEKAGTDYEPSSYLRSAIDAGLRDRMTVISGTSHPEVDGGHSAEKSFLTAARHPGSRSFKNSISLDQILAKSLGSQTRYSSLTLGDLSLSWSANGVPIPTENSPAATYARLFMKGSDKEVAKQKRDLDDGRSIMDTVLDDARTLERDVSVADREKLDQYFTAVRETERRLEKAQVWSDTPKPVVELDAPERFPGTALIERMRVHFELMRLALMTDSTRVIAYGGTNNSIKPALPGVQGGYHGLSHHGQNPEMLGQLEIIEQATIEVWKDFVVGLSNTQDLNGNTLLDSTQVLLGSNLGSASGHLTTNLPIILAGGHWKHGRHLAFDRKENYPLPKLFISMMQKMQLETDTFAGQEGTMTGLV